MGFNETDQIYQSLMLSHQGYSRSKNCAVLCHSLSCALSRDTFLLSCATCMKALGGPEGRLRHLLKSGRIYWVNIFEKPRPRTGPTSRTFLFGLPLNFGFFLNICSSFYSLSLC